MKTDSLHSLPRTTGYRIVHRIFCTAVVSSCILCPALHEVHAEYYTVPNADQTTIFTQPSEGGNTVTITGDVTTEESFTSSGLTYRGIIGGKTESGDANGNLVMADSKETITIKGFRPVAWGAGDTSGGTVVGGFTSEGNADNSIVNLRNVMLEASWDAGAVGGWTTAGSASGNAVVLQNVTINSGSSFVNGGYVTEASTNGETRSDNNMVLLLDNGNMSQTDGIRGSKTEFEFGKRIAKNNLVGIFGGVTFGELTGKEQVKQIYHTLNTALDTTGMQDKSKDAASRLIQARVETINVAVKGLIVDGDTDGTIQTSPVRGANTFMSSKDQATLSQGTLSNNHVILYGSGSEKDLEDAAVIIHGGIIGGEIRDGVVTGNSVDLLGNVALDTTRRLDSNGNFITTGAIYGGLVQYNGNATGNIVTLSGTARIVAVEGGPEAKTMGVRGGKVRGNEDSGSANNNHVFMTDRAHVEGIVAGGESDSGEANNNTVTLSGNVTVEHARDQDSVIGGYIGSQTGNENIDKANGNAVYLRDGVNVTGHVHGGLIHGFSKNAEINDNLVVIQDNVLVSGSVYGGTISKNDKSSTENKTRTISNNEVRLLLDKGATIQGEVFAAYSDNYGANNITDNTVTVIGNNSGTTQTNLQDAFLYGSNKDMLTYDDDTFSGNTLKISGFTGQARNIGNFENIDLDLNGLTLSENTPILTLTGEALTADQITGDELTSTEQKSSRQTNLNDSHITLHSSGSATAKTDAPLVDRYEVIKNTNTESDGGLTAKGATYGNDKITVRRSGAIQALYTVEWDDKDSIDLVKQAGTEQTVPGTETVNEGRLATAGFLNTAGDFVLDRKLQCSLREDGSIPETCFYGAVSGGDLHHDLNGDKAWAHTTGTHWFIGLRSKLNEKEDTEKDINGALYVEAGWGNVDTHNRWARGDGDIHYYGIGVIGERKQKEGDWKGAYLQAHARIGRAFTDYNSHLKDGSGERLDYDKNSTYYGAGLEIGREWQYHPEYMLDSYLKYRWLHLNGYHAEINGADYRLDDIDSHRTRLGTRLNYTAEKTRMPYIGLAWEHEFDGNARGRVFEYSLKDTTMKGDSGVLELGVKFVPSEKSRWNYDFTVEGYVGQREGVMGNFVVNYLF